MTEKLSPSCFSSCISCLETHGDRFFYCSLHNRIWLSILREWILVAWVFLWSHLINQKRIFQIYVILLPYLGTELERKDMGPSIFFTYIYNLPSAVALPHHCYKQPPLQRFSTGLHKFSETKHSHKSGKTDFIHNRDMFLISRLNMRIIVGRNTVCTVSIWMDAHCKGTSSHTRSILWGQRQSLLP